MKYKIFMVSIISLLAIFLGACSGSFSESGGTYSVSVPSSDSVSVYYTESGEAATAVGGPIQSTSATQQR